MATKTARRIGNQQIRRLLLVLTTCFLYSGSLLFCPDCGTLLDLPEGQAVHVKCEQCGHLEPASCVKHPRTLCFGG
jgi:LSD1 subclass zinc finger protein